MTLARMYLRLAPPFLDKLRALARYELREPRAQAEFLLRQALRDIPPPSDSAGGGESAVVGRDPAARNEAR